MLCPRSFVFRTPHWSFSYSCCIVFTPLHLQPSFFSPWPCAAPGCRVGTTEWRDRESGCARLGRVNSGSKNSVLSAPVTTASVDSLPLTYGNLHQDISY